MCFGNVEIARVIMPVCDSVVSITGISRRFFSEWQCVNLSGDVSPERICMGFKA